MPTSELKPAAFVYRWNCSTCEHDTITAHLPSELPDEGTCDECGGEAANVDCTQLYPLAHEQAAASKLAAALRNLAEDLAGLNFPHDGTIGLDLIDARAALAEAGQDV